MKHLRDDVHAEGLSADDEIPVICTLCRTRMYASRLEIGQSIICPDCDTINRVVAPKPARPATQLIERGPSYRVAAPADVSGLQNAVREVLTKASEQLRDEEQRRPKKPAHPLISGIYGFLLRPRIALLYLTLTIGAMMALIMVQSVSQLNAVFMPIVCALGAIIAAAVVVVSSVSFISIVERTANGLDEIDEWPEFSVIDWMLQSLFLVNSLVFTWGPCVIVANDLLRIPGALAIALLLAPVVLFPVVLLSMLEESSPWMPYSAVIWKSLGRRWRAWATFHLHTLALGGCVALIVWAARPAGSVWMQLLVVFLVATTSIVYFRLLGRLAWVIGRDVRSGVKVPPKPA